MSDKIEISLANNSYGTVKINGVEIENVRGLELTAEVSMPTRLTLQLIGVDVLVDADGAYVDVDITSIADIFRKSDSLVGKLK